MSGFNPVTGRFEGTRIQGMTEPEPVEQATPAMIEQMMTNLNTLGRSPFGQPQGRLDFSAYGQGESIPLKDLQYSMPTDQRADASVMSQFVGTGPQKQWYKPMQGMGSSGSMSSSGIGSLLTPIIEAAKQQSHQDLQGRITPYVEQVTQLTNQFFPNVSLSGQGMNQGVGGFFNSMNIQPMGSNQFGGGLLFGKSGINPMPQNQNNSSNNPFGVGSFFR